LKTSLDTFKEAIEKAVKNKKLTDINSQDVTAKIDAFKTAKTDFFKSETSAQYQEMATQIDEAIAAISNVIDPLNQGLTNPDKVEEVQRYLKLGEKDKYIFGNFGPLTQITIDRFLTDEFGKLDNTINQLDNFSAEKPPANSDKPKPALSTGQKREGGCQQSQW
jgi:uncharacterized protein YnzC (UPF0291/DUF896 family)